MRIRIPHNWRPRNYQLEAWTYLETGGRHAELIWHRRAGKDDVCLHWSCVAAHQRVANYWHMLPLANQARKAIWSAVNPHTGKRRIDEAFPKELRETTRDQEMCIVLRNGSTWQVLGSDNYQGAIGSSPAGITYSEWAQSDPSSRGYLRPILAENAGWQLYITTPRGHNHAERTYRAAKADPNAFAQILTAEQTGVFTAEALATELAAYITEYGEDFGRALFNQEYLCSFDAAIVGAYYGAEMAKADKEGRICRVPHDPDYPVHTAWDLGYTDDTAIWWFQIIGRDVHVIDYHFESTRGLDHYASQVLGRRVTLELSAEGVVATIGEPIPELAHRREYRYETHNLPHDAKSKSILSFGKSAQEQLASVFGWDTLRLVDKLSLEDGIQAARTMFPRVVIDEERCADGIDALRQYQREWDDDRKAFKPTPLHNWASHPADAWRYLAVAYQMERPKSLDKPKVLVPFTPEWIEYDETEENNGPRYR